MKHFFTYFILTFLVFWKRKTFISQNFQAGPELALRSLEFIKLLHYGQGCSKFHSVRSSANFCNYIFVPVTTSRVASLNLYKKK